MTLSLCRSLVRYGIVRSRRALSTAPPPQAYLHPLALDPSDPRAEELQGVMLLSMDREKARNALSRQMVAEMREGISKASSSSSTRLLLLHSAHPKIFCSGADLRERTTMSPSEVSTFLDSLRSLMGELEDLRIPTIGVVDGFALGGGLELALSCDLRIGGENSVLSLPETKLGIIPGAGGTQRLTRLIGPSKSMELIYTGRRVGPVEAEKIGLINLFAQPPQTPLKASLNLARQILTSAPLALAAAKRAIKAGDTLPIDQGLDLERELYDPLLVTEDRQEGLKAFAEKRRARFSGR
ncbi:ClpP/crotonase-like domain-containing protein [Naematelia encephala]|uniref:ClpP/crotonase-like domain-containing protein n=1 Tax=Naematelia encephala TaxID=71784 RepID=A0A1Y2AF90_9TREE|nr:ClpP/crotonase-like domain-containing protein [Naematelia encephala]